MVLLVVLELLKDTEVANSCVLQNSAHSALIDAIADHMADLMSVYENREGT